jgi:uncharacterized protein with beta-barrel porin domain
LLDGRSTAYGGLIGVDRVIRPDLLVGGFLGGGSSRQTTGFGQQADDTDYIFGGAYGRFDWRTQFLDFALYGGSTSTSTNRTVSNNLAPAGLETATGKFNGWFISPELTYGYRFMLPDGFMLTPTAKVRYLAAFLDGFAEAGSAQNMSVQGRTVEDAEERLLLDVSKVFSNSSGQALKLSVQGGFVALQRVGGTNVSITLLGPSLSFATPGKDHTVGEMVAGGFDLRVTNRVSVFGTGEFTWMDDKSSTVTGKGGVRISF